MRYLILYVALFRLSEISFAQSLEEKISDKLCDCFKKGHSEIREYFNDYFIGYNTQTRIIQVSIVGQKVHIDAEFNGNAFKNLKGVFDITFEGDKIKFVKAYLV